MSLTTRQAATAAAWNSRSNSIWNSNTTIAVNYFWYQKMKPDYKSLLKYFGLQKLVVV